MSHRLLDQAGLLQGTLALLLPPGKPGPPLLRQVGSCSIRNPWEGEAAQPILLTLPGSSMPKETSTQLCPSKWHLWQFIIAQVPENQDDVGTCCSTNSFSISPVLFSFVSMMLPN